jgi:hypothetical protein
MAEHPQRGGRREQCPAAEREVEGDHVPVQVPEGSLEGHAGDPTTFDA